MAIEDGAREEEKSNSTTKLLWSCGKATLGARQLEIRGGPMMTDRGARRRKEEQDVAEEDEVSG